MKYTIFLSLSLLFIGCKKPVHRNDEITKIDFARSATMFDPGVSISIDNTLIYKYNGDIGNTRQGYFTGKIDKDFWDTLNRKLNKINYKALPEHDNVIHLDAAIYELIISSRSGKKRFTTSTPQESSQLFDIVGLLNLSYKTIKLQQVKDSIIFETTVHKTSSQSIK